MKKILVLVVFILCTVSLYSESDRQPRVEDYRALQKLIVYPEIAKKYGMESKVIIAVYIDSTGNPTKTKIMDSPNPVFDQTAIDAVMNYQGYVPAIMDNKPVGCWIQIPFNFKLHSGNGFNYPTYDIIEYDKKELSINIKKVQSDLAYFGTGFVKIDLSVNENGDITQILPIDSDNQLVNGLITKAIKNTKFLPALQNGKPVDSFINLYISISIPDTTFKFNFLDQPIVMNYQKDSSEIHRYAILKEGDGDNLKNLDTAKVELTVYDIEQKEIGSEIINSVYGDGQINSYIEKCMKNMQKNQVKLIWLSNDMHYKVGNETYPKDIKFIKEGKVFLKIKVLEINPK